MYREDLEQISQFFHSRLPRYTSYPTAAEFEDVADYQRAAHEIVSLCDSKAPLSLYIHLPYCPKLCHFCACNKIISKNLTDIDAYLTLLEKEAALTGLYHNTELDVHQIHYGGGSPSYLSVSQLERLHALLPNQKNSRYVEKSVELDCRTTDSEKLALLYEQGFRRFSLGIQDIDPGVQKLVNREQSLSLIQSIVHLIRLKENTSVNFDLIYGLPGQTLSSFNASIKEVIRLSPDRIALYGYAHVTHKVKVQRALEKHSLPSAPQRLEIFQQAYQTLTDSGYVYIGLDHFAKRDDGLAKALYSGDLKRNFMGYCVDASQYLIGLGLSAITDSYDYLVQNYINIEQYSEAIQKGQLAVHKIAKRTPEDKVRNSCIQSLMCRRTVKLGDLMRTYPDHELVTKIFTHARDFINKMSCPSLISANLTEIYVTDRGAPFLRQFASLFDRHIKSSSLEIYSSAI